MVPEGWFVIYYMGYHVRGHFGFFVHVPGKCFSFFCNGMCIVMKEITGRYNLSI